MPTTDAWHRLGELLVRRRIELDSRYANRQVFASERGLNYRMVSAVERGERSNYDDSSIAAFEVGYKLPAGAIAGALAGGGLEPVPPPQQPRLSAVPEPEAPPSDDVIDVVLWRLIQLIPPGLDREALEALMRLPMPVRQRLPLLRALLEAHLHDGEDAEGAAGQAPARPGRLA